MFAIRLQSPNFFLLCSAREAPKYLILLIGKGGRVV